MLADKGYHGAGHSTITPYKDHNKPEPRKDSNSARLGERANAQLKTWRVLRKLRTGPQPGHL